VAASCVRSTALEGDLSALLGQPHYSYRFAEAKFAAAFAAAGVPLPLIAMPECHATAAALGLGAAGGTLVHLIFRSTEQIRLLKPAVNICCFAWEFEVLRDWTAPGEHPFLNQVRMLSLCDEIWVPCRFTAAVLRAHGVDRVHVIPAPVRGPATGRPSLVEALMTVGPVGAMPLLAHFLRPQADVARDVAARGLTLIDRLAPRRSEPPPLIYLTILNPEDFRKNLDALLRGFHHFQQAVVDAVLIVKVVTAEARFSLERVIAEVVPPKLAGGSILENDNIVFVGGFLSETQMSALFGLADFYLCASLAEGQNLPLLEAMAHGCVPVTTANTAMADYITPDNAFVIETTRVAAPTEHLAGSRAGRPYQVDLCGARQVRDALLRSARARPPARRRRAEEAARAAREGFGHAAVWPAIAARLIAAAATARG
jgi:glycosyltransferase involved in cell wall biosynthesis